MQPLGTNQLPFRAPGLGHERAAIGHADFHKPVRQVRVQRVPLLPPIRLVREDDLDQQHVRKRIADGLVDHVDYGEEVLEAGLLRWRTRKRFVRVANVLEGLIGKEDCAVSVRLEVNANCVFLGGMVQVLYTGWNEIFVVSTLEGGGPISVRWKRKRGKSTCLFEIVGGCTVCICRLDDANASFELVLQPRPGHELFQEASDKSSDLVTIQHMECPLSIQVVVYQTIGVSIE